MNKILTTALGLALFTGCVYVDRDDNEPRHDDEIIIVEQTNYMPEIYDAVAGCEWDAYNADDIWYFEAAVDDYNGLNDVREVWADVWDERTGEWVESFELYRTSDSRVWFSDWLASSTYLSCWNPNYTVDFVAYDRDGEYDVLTVVPWTY